MFNISIIASERITHLMKQMLTTGQVAQYCGVNYRTAIRWVDRGDLKAFQLPGRGDRRIQIEDFLTFLKQKNIPIPQDFKTSQRRLLIVEDDQAIAKIIKKILQKENIETQTAENGFVAGSLAESFQPDVMTLDMNIPGIDGYEVLKAIRTAGKGSHLKNIKILVISALSEKELKKTLKIGAHDYLKKPFKKSDLLEKINGLMSDVSPKQMEARPSSNSG